MCNRIFGVMSGYQIVNGRVSKIQYAPRSSPAPVPIVPVQIPAQIAIQKPVFEPTPYEAIPAMLELVNPKPDEVLYDLGCGDARILIEAVKKYGCKAVGIELNPETVKLAQKKVDESGVGDRILIIEGDIRDYHLCKADVITMYLFPKLMDAVRYRIPGGTRVVSYSHDIPNADTEKKIVKVGAKEYIFYVWIVPYVY